MDKTTLEKANELNQKIKEFNEALNCFEWKPTPEDTPISTNPRLIIEFDDFEDDGREQITLPLILNDNLIILLRSAILTGRDNAIAEFNAL